MGVINMKIRMKKAPNESTIEETFPLFIADKMANGIQEETAKTYQSQFNAVSKHIDISIKFCDLQQSDINNMILSMRQSDLAFNSVSSYARMFRTFINWAVQEGYTNVSVPKIKDRETAQETYTEQELIALLKKPKKTCSFSENRNWVIINFLVNCGGRSKTIRFIKNKDVDLSQSQVLYRHTKNGTVQLIPLCSAMVRILREYMTIRGGERDDYLFPNIYGEQLSQAALINTIKRYNNSRGVENTSLHSFRHTFAKMYLLDCGGDAIRLQKILGHKTLVMTKRYCNLYDQDIKRDFDRLSPLTRVSPNKPTIKRINKKEITT